VGTDRADHPVRRLRHRLVLAGRAATLPRGHPQARPFADRVDRLRRAGRPVRADEAAGLLRASPTAAAA